MLAQFKYALRSRFSVRLTMFLLVAGLNAVFLIPYMLGARHIALQIVAVSITGCALAAAMIACIIIDADTIGSLFKAPKGYATMLAPVKGWKIIAGRILSMAVSDVATLSVGIIGVTTQSLLLAGDNLPIEPFLPLGEIFLLVLVGAIGYLTLMLSIFFMCAVSSGVFYRFKARTVFAVLLGIAVWYLLSFCDFALIPFGTVYRWGAFYNVMIDLSANPGMFLYLALSMLKAAVFFVPTAYLIERKINI